MTNLTKRLREAKTLSDVDPILRELGANGPVRKLVEASILQRMNPNPASYEYGISMLNEAIQYLDKSEEPATPESPAIKPKGDNFVKEEELSNGNTGHRNSGSEQSTQNTEPYSGEGTTASTTDVVNAPDTENQMSEMEKSPFPSVLNTQEMGGLHPDIAKQMGSKMPTPPPMNAGDQMKQTRYTIQKYHETVTVPLLKHSKVQDAVIKKLSQQIREIEAKTGSYTLDLDTMKQNSRIKVRETLSPNPLQMATQVQNKNFDLNIARNQIREMNNLMS